MSYSVHTTRRFDRSVEKMKKRGLPMDDLRNVITLLLIMIDTGTHSDLF